METAARRIAAWFWAAAFAAASFAARAGEVEVLHWWTSGGESRSVLELSQDGYRIYDEVVPVALEYERRLLAPLDADERVQLDRLMQKLGEGVKEMEAASDGPLPDV